MHIIRLQVGKRRQVRDSESATIGCSKPRLLAKTKACLADADRPHWPTRVPFVWPGRFKELDSRSTIPARLLGHKTKVQYADGAKIRHGVIAMLFASCL
jgi:hypothetical protein